MGKKFFSVLVCVLVLGALQGEAYPHCQIPCGIYNDDMRFDMVAEDIDTVEKSMNTISELAKDEPPNYNQIIRWVDNKDDHADKIAETVTYYFMAQRVKPLLPGEDGYEVYARQIESLHRLLVLSMRAKQSIDLSVVSEMRKTLEEFRKAYKVE